jgi:hypothetical protein
MERIFLAIWDFFKEYGWGFAMLVLSGLLVAGMVEIVVKKTHKWLSEKWVGHEKLLAFLDGAKMVMTQLVTGLLSVWFAQLVVKAVALPGGEVLLPIWVCCIYYLQYIFSMVGWKGFCAFLEERRNRKMMAKATKEKPVLEETEYDGVYRNADGVLVKKNGKPIKL